MMSNLLSPSTFTASLLVSATLCMFPSSAATTPCPVGKYTDSQNKDSCIVCPPGTYSDEVGLAFCKICGVGMYGTSQGAKSEASCKMCGAGNHVGPSKNSPFFLISDSEAKSTDPPQWGGERTVASFSVNKVDLTSLKDSQNPVWGTTVKQSYCRYKGGTSGLRSANIPTTGWDRKTSKSCLDKASQWKNSQGQRATAVYMYMRYGENRYYYYNRCTVYYGDAIPDTTVRSPYNYYSCTLLSDGYFELSKSAVLLYNLKVESPSSETCDISGITISSSETDVAGIHAKIQASDIKKDAWNSMGGLITDYVNPKEADFSKLTTVLVHGTGCSSKTTISIKNMHARRRESQAWFAECIKCEKGKFSASKEAPIGCQACAGGKYSDAVGQNKCQDCAQGKYSTNVGAAEASTCISCEKGKYTKTMGAVTCTKCWPGSFTTPSGCKACPEGKHQEFSDQTSCKACPPGTYSEVEGRMFCQVCGVGMYGTSQGAKSEATCKMCGAGNHVGPSKNSFFFLISDSEAKSTDPPQWGGERTVASFSVNKVDLTSLKDSQNPVWGTTVKQSYCRYKGGTSGLRSANIPTTGSNRWDRKTSKSCLDKASQWKNSQGQRATAVYMYMRYGENRYYYYNRCTVYYGDVIPDTTVKSTYNYYSCTLLSDEYFGLSKSAALLYNLKVESPSSETCDISGITISSSETDVAGIHAKIQASDIKKDAWNSMGGLITDYVNPKEADFSKLTTVLVHGTGCSSKTTISIKNMHARRRESQAWFAECIKCEKGKFSASKEAPIGCQACAGGKYSDAVGQNKCQDCAQGKYSTNVGAAEASTCISCEKGKYTKTMGAVTCTKCWPGSFTTPSGCKACPEGKHQEFSNQTSCKACPPGTYSDVEGRMFCQVCGVGMYGTSQGAKSEATCKMCGAGSRIGPLQNMTHVFIASSSAKFADSSGGTDKQAVATFGVDMNEIDIMSLKDHINDNPTWETTVKQSYCRYKGGTSGLRSTNIPTTGSNGWDRKTSKSCLDKASQWKNSQGQRATAVYMYMRLGENQYYVYNRCTVYYGDVIPDTTVRSPYNYYSCTLLSDEYRKAVANDDFLKLSKSAVLLYNLKVESPSSETCDISGITISSSETDVAGIHAKIQASDIKKDAWNSMGGLITDYVNPKEADFSKLTTVLVHGTGCSSKTTISIKNMHARRRESQAWFAECIKCEKGKFSASKEAPIGCQACAGGKYSDAVGQNKCQDCAQGKYSTNVGAAEASTCISCEKGKYSSASGALSCRLCDSGKYNSNTGSRNRNDCQTCKVGSYLGPKMNIEIFAGKWNIQYSSSPEYTASLEGCDNKKENDICVEREARPNPASCEGGMCYEKLSGNEKWENAINSCKKLGKGATLAMPKTKAQMKKIFEISGGRSFWVGMSDSDEEGKWMWLDGTELQKSDLNKQNPYGWGIGRPSNVKSNTYGYYNCAYGRYYSENYYSSIYRDQAMFWDYYCTYRSLSYVTVCEYPDRSFDRFGVCHDTDRSEMKDMLKNESLACIIHNSAESNFISHDEKRVIAVRSGFTADLTPFQETSNLSPAHISILKKGTTIHFDMMVSDKSSECAPTHMSITDDIGTGGFSFEIPPHAKAGKWSPKSYTLKHNDFFGKPVWAKMSRFVIYGSPLCTSSKVEIKFRNIVVQNNVRGSWYEWCKECEAGTYSDTIPSIESCIRCPMGTFQQKTGMEKLSDCIACQVGKYNPETGLKNCRDCPTGKFNNETGSKYSFSCKDCELGFGTGSFQTLNDAKLSVGGFGKCEKCKAGHYGVKETASMPGAIKNEYYHFVNTGLEESQAITMSEGTKDIDSANQNVRFEDPAIVVGNKSTSNTHGAWNNLAMSGKMFIHTAVDLGKNIQDIKTDPHFYRIYALEDANVSLKIALPGGNPISACFDNDKPELKTCTPITRKILSVLKEKNIVIYGDFAGKYIEVISDAPIIINAEVQGGNFVQQLAPVSREIYGFCRQSCSIGVSNGFKTDITEQCSDGSFRVYYGVNFITPYSTSTHWETTDENPTFNGRSYACKWSVPEGFSIGGSSFYYTTNSVGIDGKRRLPKTAALTFVPPSLFQRFSPIPSDMIFGVGERGDISIASSQILIYTRIFYSM